MNQQNEPTKQLTLEEKLAMKQAEFEKAVKNGEKSVCNLDNIEGCENCGS